jgi:two-component system phosphate regulon response regulator OmpR
LLLVEDDPKLGPLLAKVLSSSGYIVTLARDAAEARAVTGEDLELAVVDRMLPELAARRLRRAHPDADRAR